MAGEETVRFRLLRLGDAPATNPEGDAYDFGLQDTSDVVHPGARLPDGRLAFDFELRVRAGKNGRPNFLGPFASGPVGERFVYLAWRSIPRGVWINRVKAPLAPIDWPLIEQARAENRPIVADLTGRAPGGGRRPIDWRLG
jgi:hypothetical protein